MNARGRDDRRQRLVDMELDRDILFMGEQSHGCHGELDDRIQLGHLAATRA